MKFALPIGFLFLFFLMMTPQRSEDLYFDVQAGRRFLQPGLSWQDKLRDPFSFGETKPLLTSPWLAEIVIASVHIRWGLLGDWVAKALLALGGLLFLYGRCRKRKVSPLLSLFFTLFAGCLTLYFFNFRARNFTYLFFSAFLFMIETQPLSWRWLAFYPFLLLWRNLHAASVLATVVLLLIFLYKFFLYFFPHFPLRAKESAKGLGLLLLLTLIFYASDLSLFTRFFYPSSFLSTFGLSSSAPQPDLTKALIQQLTEWHGIWWLHPQNLFFLSFLLLTLFALLLAFPRVDGKDLLFMAAFIPLPFFAQRHEDIVVIALMPITAQLTAQAWQKWSRKLSLSAFIPPGASLLAFLLFATLALLGTFLLPFRFLFSTPLNPPERFEKSYLPVRAQQLIQLNQFPKRMFNDPDWGGYLMYTIYPQYKVAFDGRFLSAYTSRYTAKVLDVLNAAKGWQKFMQRYHIQFALLRPYRPLSRALQGDPDWLLIYQDPISQLFLHLTKATEAIERAFYKNSLSYPDDILFLRSMAELWQRRGNLHHAELFLQKALNLRESASLLTSLGMLHLKAKQEKKAVYNFQRAVKVDPAYLPALINLSLYYQQKGKREKAFAYYQKAKKIQPKSPAVQKLALRLKIPQ